MSPRRRGRGRHEGAGGGANGGAVLADAQVAPDAQLDHNEPSAALNGSGGTASASGSQLNGGRPNGGRPVPPRREIRPRPALGPQPVDGEEPTAQPRHTCTLAQMRRFIKSRPYVPVHELRRRFAIEGVEDEVSPVATDKGIIYVGLPPQEAQFLGDLIKGGDVGCEMLLDPDSPAVIGVFPMRPVARQ